MADNLPTGRELEALKVLWVRGKATVREIYDEMRPQEGDGELAYTTVLSLLQTMEQKELVGHELSGKAYIYRPLVQRETPWAIWPADFSTKSLMAGSLSTLREPYSPASTRSKSWRRWCV